MAETGAVKRTPSAEATSPSPHSLAIGGRACVSYDARKKGHPQHQFNRPSAPENGDDALTINPNHPV